MTREQRAIIARSIGAAEEGTTGRIAVRIIPNARVDALVHAEREFERLRLHRHEDANAALILVAPRARRFAVLGDRALHERVGEAFWNEVVERSRPYFARGDVVEGILVAVRRIGEALHEHFAQRSSDRAT